MSIFDRAELYVDNYYDYGIFRDNSGTDETLTSEKSFYVTWLSFGRFVLTLLLRIGFVLVEIGSVPVTNINLILLQNIVDFSWITIVYVIGGFVVSYNGDLNGLIGQGRWIGDATVSAEDAIVGWQSANVASAICASLLIGRTHTIGYLFYDLIAFGIVQPFAIHWAWTSEGWMTRNVLQEHSVAFHDYAGSTIVHTIGSLTGYIGCVILGRRIIRLRDIDDASIPADSAGTAFAGYFLILLGLQSLCFPSTSDENSRKTNKNMSLVIVNNLLGASSCSLAVVALHFIHSNREPFNHWTVMRCVQASIAGMTIVSAGIDRYNPAFSLGLGLSGGIIHYLVSRRIFQSALEDYCNVVGTHLVCSIVGTLVAPFGRVTRTEIVQEPLAIFLNFAWQIICLVTIVTMVTISMTMTFGLLECLGLLRNRAEIVNHLRAIVATERGPPRSYMQRLFLPEGETLYLQPCTAHLKRHRGQTNNLRFSKPDLDLTKVSKKNSQENIANSHQFPNSSVLEAAKSPPNHSLEKRVKKFRQVHTLRSRSEIDFGKIIEHEKAMGDNEKSLPEENKNIGNKVDGKICQNDEISIVECSGDSLTSKFARLETLASKNIEIEKTHRRQPYKLHRTQKFTNLRLEAINENKRGIEFIVRPKETIFSSTESDSENEKVINNSLTKIPVKLFEEKFTTKEDSFAIT